MLRKVFLSSDVFTVCMQHALSTEKEEIMGLLIGEVDEKSTVVSIVASIILRRSDKKPDRVEISEEQLVQAAEYAEKLQSHAGKPLRVVGWYHSHPHITVWPSHVDLSTQTMYQRMDPSFVGLIFAVFLTDQTTKAHEVQVTCFQALESGGAQTRREVPLELAPPDPLLLHTCLETLIQLPEILREEEEEACCKETVSEADFLTQQHNAAVRTIAMGHIADKMTRPMLEVLTARNELSQLRLHALQQHHQVLMQNLQQCLES